MWYHRQQNSHVAWLIDGKPFEIRNRTNTVPRTLVILRFTNRVELVHRCAFAFAVHGYVIGVAGVQSARLKFDRLIDASQGVTAYRLCRCDNFAPLRFVTGEREAFVAEIEGLERGFMIVAVVVGKNHAAVGERWTSHWHLSFPAPSVISGSTAQRLLLRTGYRRRIGRGWRNEALAAFWDCCGVSSRTRAP